MFAYKTFTFSRSVLAQVSSQYAIVQIYPVREVSLSFSLKHVVSEIAAKYGKLSPKSVIFLFNPIKVNC